MLPFHVVFLLLVAGAFCTLDKKIPPEFFLAETSDSDGETWVVLVAGANSWMNYWSQAQVYAAYHQLRQAGIQDDRIIVWHYDDIATNKENPFPGKVYLFDPSQGAPDVYVGVPKDLTGSDVTPANFMKLLSGETMTIGSGKSLRSTSKDRIFIYFSDHGGPGEIFFPGMFPMHAADLISTLKEMHEKNLYKEMVFYLDTCESGSVFSSHFPNDINIYAATSTDPTHVAWLCDCKWIPPNKNFPCTSNCWGKFWIYDALGSMKKGTFGTRNFVEQYDTCRNETYHDHCYYWPKCDQQSCWYGDQSIAKNNPLVMFEGPGTKKNTDSVPMSNVYVELPKNVERALGNQDILQVDRVPSSHAHWFYYKKQAAISNSLEAQLDLQRYEKMMKDVDSMWAKVSERFDLEPVNSDIYNCWPKDTPDLDCLKEMYEMTMRLCGRFNEYSAGYGKILSQACVQNVSVMDVEELLTGLCA